MSKISNESMHAWTLLLLFKMPEACLVHMPVCDSHIRNRTLVKSA